MAYEQKDNSGSIFVNDRKEKDNYFDRTGTALIDGTEYWVSGWLKKSKDGKPFLSLAFKPKDASTKPEGGGLSGGFGGGTRKPSGPIDDDIPF
jgi:hypothetical protein